MPTKLSDSNYEKHLENNNDALLFFTASWCGPCKQTKPHYEKAENELQSLNPELNLSFCIIDVDEAPNAATFFNIECMPTFVLIKDNVVVDRIMGGMDYKKMLSLINKHFDTPKTMNQITQNNPLRHL